MNLKGKILFYLKHLSEKVCIQETQSIKSLQKYLAWMKLQQNF